MQNNVRKKFADIIYRNNMGNCNMKYTDKRNEAQVYDNMHM